MATEDRELATRPQGGSPAVRQLAAIYRNIPLSRKIMMAAVILLVMAGFGAMFFWANKIDYQALYSGLSAQDAAEIVEKLKESNVPYQLTGGGGTVLVPAEHVYDLRLTLAASGMPKGGSVGYELFDETKFGTTEFVQKMNYQRALQGELARTIREFQEVEDARVMIVMPKDSVFIEETKPPSASVLLKLKSGLSSEKVKAVVHLVASAIEGMAPDLVTVVDTKGKVLYKGATEEEKIGELANTQLKYKLTFESNLATRIQSMLEQIVGEGNAIVRVTADMAFDQVNVNEELYDPDVSLVRSRQNLIESSETIGGPGTVSSVNRVVPQGEEPAGGGSAEKSSKQDETVNYELNRTVRRTIKPIGELQRLSVAAVLDGSYTMEVGEDGKTVRKYVPRTTAELEQFRSIVRNAMGYSEDREDQITVESFPFSYTEEMVETGTDWKGLIKQYGRSFFNILLVFLLFVFVVLPLVKTIKEIKTTVVESLPAPEEAQASIAHREAGALMDPSKMGPREKAVHYAGDDPQKTSAILRKWVGEAS